jgi:hypothetical protein
MRRSLILVFWVALVPVGALQATAAASDRASVAPMIVCPLEPATGATCCGPPILQPRMAAIPCCAGAQIKALPICCPPNAVCATALTIASGANPSTAGQQVTISGQLSAAAGTQVTLWERLPGETAFANVGQTTATASTGSVFNQYTFVRPGGLMQTDRSWYVTAGSAQSVTLSQQVRAVVTLRARLLQSAEGSGTGAHRVAFSGHVSPSHAGERVIAQQRVGGSWRTLGRPRLNRASEYSFDATAVHTTHVEVRVVLSADQRNAWSASKVVALPA